MSGRLPGKVFLSHSSADKSFVRRLDEALRVAGFDTWLDEHEMVPGDPLPKKISGGLAHASAVIIVISSASARSDWLDYELQIATKRMVQGLRLIPVLLEDADVPEEIDGIFYTDFRTDFDAGLDDVLAALKQEEERLSEPEPDDWWASWVGRDRHRRIMSEIFDSYGFTSGLGEYRDDDYDFMVIGSASGDDIELPVEVVGAYGHRTRTLTSRFWEEFLEAALASEPRCLLITERPVAEVPPGIVHGVLQGEDRIHILRDNPYGDRYLQNVFVLDVSGEINEDEERRLLGLIRSQVEDEAGRRRH